MELEYDIFETSAGWVGALASKRGLRRTTLPLPTPHECAEELGMDMGSAQPSPRRFEGLKHKIELYLQGEPANLDDEQIDVEDAAPFHQAAWRAARTIPPGETRSYQWLAAQAGRPQAARAAGQSMARNRLWLVVPCHRVVASDGGLGGYGKDASDLRLKQQLLDLEQLHATAAAP